MTSALQTGCAHDAVQYFSACLVFSYFLHTKNKCSSLSCIPGQNGQSLSISLTPLLAYRFLCTLRLLIPSLIQTKQSLKHFCFIQSKRERERERESLKARVNVATEDWQEKVSIFVVISGGCLEPKRQLNPGLDHKAWRQSFVSVLRRFSQLVCPLTSPLHPTPAQLHPPPCPHVF